MIKMGGYRLFEALSQEQERQHLPYGCCLRLFYL